MVDICLDFVLISYRNTLKSEFWNTRENELELDMVAQACNLNTQEGEAGECPWDRAQPDLHSELYISLHEKRKH